MKYGMMIVNESNHNRKEQNVFQGDGTLWNVTGSNISYCDGKEWNGLQYDGIMWDVMGGGKSYRNGK